MVGRVVICEDLVVVVMTFISTYCKLSCTYRKRGGIGSSSVFGNFLRPLEVCVRLGLPLHRTWTRVGCVADVYSRLWLMIQVYAYYF